MLPLVVLAIGIVASNQAIAQVLVAIRKTLNLQVSPQRVLVAENQAIALIILTNKKYSHFASNHAVAQILATYNKYKVASNPCRRHPQNHLLMSYLASPKYLNSTLIYSAEQKGSSEDIYEKLWTITTFFITRWKNNLILSPHIDNRCLNKTLKIN